jgi:photosystem II stability/assembly factor-like uncharacterized protein
MKNSALSLLVSVLLTSASIAQPQWHVQNSGSNRELTGVIFVDQNNGWISGWTGTMLHTTDGGENWSPQTIPPNNAYYNVYFTDLQNGWATGYSGKIIHTSDGGQNWVIQPSPVSMDFYDSYFINPEMGWITGGDYGSFPSYIKHRVILYTSNGGNSWSVQYNQSDQSPLQSIFFIDQNNGFATGESGTIMKTTDGGSNWVEQTVLSFYNFYDIFFTDNSTGWVAGEYAGLPYYSAILKTSDGGNNWIETALGTDEILKGIYFTDSTNGWAVGSDVNNAGIVYHTSDGGDNWTLQSIPAVDGLFSVFFLNENSGWAVGHLGTIIATNNQVPVELTSFTANAENNNVNLAWQTSTEINNSGFEIQRRKTDKNVTTSGWTKIGFAEGHGTTTNKNNYSFIDKDPGPGSYLYKLVQIDFDGTRNESKVVNIEVSSKPAGYVLMQNYPNPFNPATTIEYSIPSSGNVTLKVYNAIGEEVKTLVNNYQAAGDYKVNFNAITLSAGVYFYRLKTDKYSLTKKLLLLK